MRHLERAGVNVQSAFDAGGDGGDKVVAFSPGHPIGPLANDLLGGGGTGHQASTPHLNP